MCFSCIGYIVLIMAQCEVTFRDALVGSSGLCMACRKSTIQHQHLNTTHSEHPEERQHEYKKEDINSSTLRCRKNEKQQSRESRERDKEILGSQRLADHLMDTRHTHTCCQSEMNETEDMRIRAGEGSERRERGGVWAGYLRDVRRGGGVQAAASSLLRPAPATPPLPLSTRLTPTHNHPFRPHRGPS